MTAIPIVALDYPDTDTAMMMVERLGPACSFYKVGSELFTSSGAEVVQWLRDMGRDVFLDLKFHDIPNTVAGAVSRVAAMGVRLTTVHASGGSKMMDVAVKAAGPECGVLAVTVLTSLDDAQLSEAWGKDRVDVQNEVLRLAELARSSGVHGIVCSGEEAEAVSGRHGSALKLLVPGIRLPGDSAGDQSRIVTPEAAAAAGASYIVVGRSVTKAADPCAAMAEVNRRLRP